MKILKKGNGQKGWAVKSTCTGHGNGDGGCGAKLLVERGDLRQTTRCCRDETDYFATFECPECGVKTDLDDGVLSDTGIRPQDLPRFPRQDSSDPL